MHYDDFPSDLPDPPPGMWDMNDSYDVIGPDGSLIVPAPVGLLTPLAISALRAMVAAHNAEVAVQTVKHASLADLRTWAYSSNWVNDWRKTEVRVLFDLLDQANAVIQQHAELEHFAKVIIPNRVERALADLNEGPLSALLPEGCRFVFTKDNAFADSASEEEWMRQQRMLDASQSVEAPRDSDALTPDGSLVRREDR